LLANTLVLSFLPRTKREEIYHEPHEPARTEKEVRFTTNICVVES